MIRENPFPLDNPSRYSSYCIEFEDKEQKQNVTRFYVYDSRNLHLDTIIKDVSDIANGHEFIHTKRLLHTVYGGRTFKKDTAEMVILKNQFAMFSIGETANYECEGYSVGGKNRHLEDLVTCDLILPTSQSKKPYMNLIDDLSNYFEKKYFISNSAAINRMNEKRKKLGLI